MEKILFSYINKKNQSIVIMCNEFEDTFYKIDLDGSIIEKIIDPFVLDVILDDVKENSIFNCIECYHDMLLSYIEENEIEINFEIVKGQENKRLFSYCCFRWYYVINIRWYVWIMFF